jgi:endonuclease/exonuclease/phosphatase family metal-dependent hydrolase
MTARIHHIRIYLMIFVAGLLANPTFLQIAFAQEMPRDAVRVMSFNIRLGVAKDGENHWDKRKDMVVKTIEAFAADIIGTQETWSFQAAYLGEQLAGYGYAGRSRQIDSDQGEQCGIFFKVDRFDKLVEGHFWLSETPDEPGSKSWDSSLPRMVTWLKLWDRKNKRSFYILNTHFDHRGKTAREESSKLLRRFVTDLKTDVDVVITGDFNAGEGSAPYRALFAADEKRRSVVDTFRAFVPEKASGQGTFNGFKGTDDGARIDWIAATDGFEVESAAIEKTSFDNRFPSDHFPVSAVLKFRRDDKREGRND